MQRKKNIEMSRSKKITPDVCTMTRAHRHFWRKKAQPNTIPIVWGKRCLVLWNVTAVMVYNVSCYVTCNSEQDIGSNVAVFEAFCADGNSWLSPCLHVPLSLRTQQQLEEQQVVPADAADITSRNYLRAKHIFYILTSDGIRATTFSSLVSLAANNKCANIRADYHFHLPHAYTIRQHRMAFDAKIIRAFPRYIIFNDIIYVSWSQNVSTEIFHVIVGRLWQPSATSSKTHIIHIKCFERCPATKSRMRWCCCHGSLNWHYYYFGRILTSRVRHTHTHSTHSHTAPHPNGNLCSPWRWWPLIIIITLLKRNAHIFFAAKISHKNIFYVSFGFRLLLLPPLLHLLLILLLLLSFLRSFYFRIAQDMRHSGSHIVFICRLNSSL